MIAYSACGAAERAMDFWEDIIYSREGPTYNSIRIALRACELMPYGQDKAKDIWKRLKKFEIEINKDIYAAYVAALAGNMLIEESLDMLDKMEAEIGVPPDPLTLGMVYNASPGVERKSQIEAFIKEKYPGAWEELENLGWDRPSMRPPMFRIDRTVPA